MKALLKGLLTVCAIAFSSFVSADAFGATKVTVNKADITKEEVQLVCPNYIEATFSAVYDQEFINEIRSEIRSKAEREIEDPESFFNSAEVNQSNFSLRFNDSKYEGSWRHIERVLGPDYYVTYTTFWNNNRLQVVVNPILTVIDGISLDAYGSAGILWEVDECASKQFQKNLTPKASESNQKCYVSYYQDNGELLFTEGVARKARN